MDARTVVVIGCGERGVAHVEAYGLIGGARVTACCSRTPARAEAMAARFGLHAYTNPAAMIERERPALVHIATPPTARLDLLALVSDLGVTGCTVEKPIATGVEDWRALRDLCRRTRTRIAVCHQCRWHPDLVRCRQALAGGALGRVLFLDISAGMNISGQGTHILNYGASLAGDPAVTVVFGTAGGAGGMSGYHPAPDSSTAALSFAGGVRGSWTNGPAAPRCGDPGTDWQHVRVAAFAERGRVLWEEFGRWEIAGPAGVDRGDFGGMTAWQRNNRRAQAGFHEAVLAWIDDAAAEPGTSLDRSLHEWHAVLALYASALERRPVELAQFGPPSDLFDRLGRALHADADMRGR